VSLDERDLRDLLSRAAPDVDAPVAVDADLERGRTALGRRRSLLATVAVGAGTALVALAAVLVPQGVAGFVGDDGVPASGSSTTVQDGTRDDAPDRGAAADPAPPGDGVPLVAGPQQRTGDVVATLVPQGWEVRSADRESLVLADPATGEEVHVTPAARTREPPVLQGVGDFERVGGARASYYLLDSSGGTARPTMVLELTFGRWSQVSASPSLGWGMPELTAFASGLRAPFTCADPCEVPLAP
jgi:pimeloyl-ACP methyl ester carboxylesterase